MILWLKYNKKSFNPDNVVNASIERNKHDSSYNSLWTWIQPGDYELWTMGKNNRYLITVDSQECFHFEGIDFILPKSKEELKIWIDMYNVKIGNRIGFSECMYDFNGMKDNEYKDMLWVGYKLITDVEVLK